MKKNARQLSDFLCLTAALFGSPALAQTPEITATSQQFAVTKFFYIDSSKAIGFASELSDSQSRR